MNQTLENITAVLLSHKWETAIVVLGLVWLGSTYGSQIVEIVKMTFNSSLQKKDDGEIPTGMLHVDEYTLYEEPRQRMFYYLEQIRAYASDTGNKDAEKDCVSLLNNLFREFPKTEIVNDKKE